MVAGVIPAAAGAGRGRYRVSDCSARGSASAPIPVAANLAGGTHHAFRDHGEGYCVFNDVAVAAAVLLRDGQITCAAVVDCDVHQGNGTAAIFHDQPAVFTFSLHGAKNFPFRKEVSDLDVTFEDGAGNDEYSPRLTSICRACSTASGQTSCSISPGPIPTKAIGSAV